MKRDVNLTLFSAHKHLLHTHPIEEEDDDVLITNIFVENDFR